MSELSFIHSELKEIKKTLGEQAVDIRKLVVTQAVHKEKFDNNRRFHSMIWGIVGGFIGGIIDFFLRRL